MSDERPQPKYGELAPEGWSWTPPPSPYEQAPEEEVPSRPAEAAPATRRRGDFWVTMTLLGLGIFFTLTSAPGYLDLGPMMSQLFAQEGLGQFTAWEVAGRAGQIAVISQVVILVASIAVSILLVRKGRLSFYVPLTGAALSFIVSLVCVTVALLADPAVLELSTIPSSS